MNKPFIQHVQVDPEGMALVDEIIHSEVVVTISRKVYFGRNLSMGIIMKTGDKTVEDKVIKYLLDKYYLRALRDCYSWEVGVGVIPYAETIDPETGAKIPVVLPWRSGTIHTGYNPGTFKQEWKWLPDSVHPTSLRLGAKKNSPTMYDERIKFYPIPDRHPEIDGTLRSDISSVIQDYRTVKRFIHLALIIEKSKAQMPRVFETELPKDSDTIRKLPEIIQALSEQHQKSHLPTVGREHGIMVEKTQDLVTNLIGMYDNAAKWSQRKGASGYDVNEVSNTGSSMKDNVQGVETLRDAATGMTTEVHTPPFVTLRQLTVGNYSSDLVAKVESFERKLAAALDVTSMSMGSGTTFRNEMQTFAAQTYSIYSTTDRVMIYQDIIRVMWMGINHKNYKREVKKFFREYNRREAERAKKRSDAKRPAESAEKINARQHAASSYAREIMDIKFVLLVRAHLYTPNLDMYINMFEKGYIDPETFSESMSEMIGAPVQLERAREVFEYKKRMRENDLQSSDNSLLESPGKKAKVDDPVTRYESRQSSSEESGDGK